MDKILIVGASAEEKIKITEALKFLQIKSSRINFLKLSDVMITDSGFVMNAKTFLESRKKKDQ